MAKITISEALNWRKTLLQRHSELVQLRNENSHEETRFLGANADKTFVKKVLYDARGLDRMVTAVAREQRILDNALKRTNAATQLLDYEQDDTVLGELQMEPKE